MRTIRPIFFCSFLFLLTSVRMSAQFGINVGYQINQSEGWIPSGATEPIVSNGYKAGIDYWFRLKQKRIEFTPEVSYAFYESAYLPEMTNDRVAFFSLQINTQFYLLDLLNDCNCPTFSKQNNFFKKGFFLRLSPGLTRLHWASGWGKVQPTLGMGIGLDIGVSDLLTISPLLTFRYLPKLEWAPVIPPQIHGAAANFWQFSPGLRLGFRLDH